MPRTALGAPSPAARGGRAFWKYWLVMSQHGQTQPRKQPGVLGAGCCWGVCQASLSAGGWGWRGWGGVGDLAFPPCLCFIPSPPSLSRFQQVIPKFLRATEKIKRALYKAHTQQKALEGALRKRPAGRRVCNHTTCERRDGAWGRPALCTRAWGPAFPGPRAAPAAAQGAKETEPGVRTAPSCVGACPRDGPAVLWAGDMGGGGSFQDWFAPRPSRLPRGCAPIPRALRRFWGSGLQRGGKRTWGDQDRFPRLLSLGPFSPVDCFPAFPKHHHLHSSPLHGPPPHLRRHHIPGLCLSGPGFQSFLGSGGAPVRLPPGLAAQLLGSQVSRAGGSPGVSFLSDLLLEPGPVPQYGSCGFSSSGSSVSSFPNSWAWSPGPVRQAQGVASESLKTAL